MPDFHVFEGEIPKIFSDSEKLMGFEFVTRRYWTLEALVGYLESRSAYFLCDIGTVKFGKSNFLTFK